MNLSPEKFNILNSNLRNGKFSNNASQNKHPKFQTTDINFRGNVSNSFCKIVNNKQVTYTNAKGIISGVDAIVGDNFLTSLLKKANVSVDDGNIVFKNRGFFDDLVSTIGYVQKVPLDVSIALVKSLRKIPFCQSMCDGILNTKLFLHRQRVIEQEKSLSCARALLDQFVSKQQGKVVEKGSKGSTLEYDLSKSLDIFKDSAAVGIVNPARNYVLRDERTLNRMGTATVSAIYSGADFYNITMLQKDDKNEAKKAETSRRKQELLRMFLSGATTYLSLGAFNKLTKNNVIASSLVIAGSSLIAEIGSRLISHTPLVRLTPEQAAQIAENNADNLKTKSAENKQSTPSKPKENNINNSQTTLQNDVSFKETSKDAPSSLSQNPKTVDSISKQSPEFKSSKSYQKSIFKDFSGENSLWRKVQENSEQKKINFKTVLKACFAGFSLLYLAKKGLSGEYIKKATDKNIYIQNQADIERFLSEKMDGLEKQKFVAKIRHEVKHKNGTKVPGDFVGYKYIDKIKDFCEENITHRKVKIPLQKIYDKLDILALPENDKGIKTLLETYRAQAGEIAVNDNVTILLRRNITSGILGGIKKMYTLAYNIFTAPINMIESMIYRLGKYKKSSDALNKVYRQEEGVSFIDKKKSISQLAQTIFNKDEVNGIYGPIESIFKKRMSNDEIIEAIKKSTRNFDQGTETGEVAHLSRTLVTLFSTYFFVNDYRNKVLIESKGRAVDEANREQKERIAHKISNFVINGTLMNVFNSTFKRPLNESLLAATLVAMSTEMTNEYMVRKSICQPIGHMESKQEIMDYEKQQLENDGFTGVWSRFFRKITGKKTLTQKAGTTEDKK